MEGGTKNLQQAVKQVFEFDGKKADDFLEWSSKLRVSLVTLPQVNLQHSTRVTAVVGTRKR